MSALKQYEELFLTERFSGSVSRLKRVKFGSKLDAFHILHAFRGGSFLLLSSIGESKVKHAFVFTDLKKVFVDQSKKNIPFAEYRQKSISEKLLGSTKFSNFHKCKFGLNCFNPCNPEWRGVKRFNLWQPWRNKWRLTNSSMDWVQVLLISMKPCWWNVFAV